MTECDKSVVMLMRDRLLIQLSHLLDINRYESLDKLLNVLRCVLQFINKLKKDCNNQMILEVECLGVLESQRELTPRQEFME